jgi:hypothetical protein
MIFKLPYSSNTSKVMFHCQLREKVVEGLKAAKDEATSFNAVAAEA